ncbi:hypothetical protein EAI_04529 [Harpegnathos saltator]|uniref:Uncharacterized protein n=1 Tax=Harpegnathos saltator TaxID=610380 RepID=E2B390_HARSA|nr:hypothetical protein EAI_04529 [Harpegnathos saltator]
MDDQIKTFLESAGLGSYSDIFILESSEQTTPKGDCIIEVISKADWKNVYALKEEDENLVNDEVLAIKNTSEESA